MLEDILKDINKEFKKELAIKGIGQLKIKKIPFTSPRLNYSTYGGVPRGRISMFAGKESSGKSSTALDIVKNAQSTFRVEWEAELNELTEELTSSKISKPRERELNERMAYLNKRGPLKIVYFDAEGTIDSDWARKLGVDVDNIFLVRLHTQTAEQFLDQVLRVVRDTDDVGLVIIDSIAVLVPQLVHGESLEQKNMGGNSKVVTDFCNQVCPILGEKDIACIIINQARDDFKNPYAEFSIPCGNGLKLASSLILTFQKGKLIDEDGKEQKMSFECPVGNLVWVRVQKTKIFKPDRRVGYYTLNYDCGVDVVADIIQLASEKYDLVQRAGSWYSVVNPDTGEVFSNEDGEPVKFQGMTALLDHLRNNEELFNYIYDYINYKINNDDSNAFNIAAEEDLKAIRESNELDNIPEEMVLR